MKKINFKSIDGLRLVADFYAVEFSSVSVLLVHGITADRKEAGLYTEICQILQSQNITCLSIDMRAHGESEGKQEDLTLSGCINDILSGIEKIKELSVVSKIIIIASSFSGGLAINVSIKLQHLVKSIVLFNPRLDYKPWIFDNSFWKQNRLSNEGENMFRNKGYIIRNNFKIGQNLFNEILCFNPSENLKELSIPLLFIHGTKDSIIPIQSVEARFNENNNSKLIQVEGSDHGFVLPEDETLANPINKDFRATVIDHTLRWIDEIKEQTT